MDQPKKRYLRYSQKALTPVPSNLDHREGKVRVLVVDDEKIVLDLLSAIFSRLGFQVIEANDGYEAMSILEQNALNLVVTDHQMPGMDGLSLAAEIKTRYSGVPVVLTSGNLEEEMMNLEGYYHVDAFLQKPIKMDDILFTIRDIEENRAVSLVR